MILSFCADPNMHFVHCTEVRFACFLSGGFFTDIVVNPPERKLAKRTSVHCTKRDSSPQDLKTMTLNAFIASDVCVTRGLRSFFTLALIRANYVMLVLAEPRRNLNAFDDKKS